jgi:hyperosmotically inducible protein
MRSAKTLLSAVAVLAALCTTAVRADQDTTVAGRVQQALVAAHIPNAENIKIQSFNGEVDLSGVVFTDRAKARAASIAVAVRGVTSVQNALEVQPRANDDDDATTARVKAALAAARIDDTGPIEVSTFNGEVDLSGVVYSNDARTRVMEVAGSTRGASSIRSEIQVQEQP